MLHPWLWKEFFVLCLECTRGKIVYATGISPLFNHILALDVYFQVQISMEYAIGGLVIFKNIHAHLPLTIVSLLVVATALPAAHWFMNDYIRSDFFQDMAIGFPIIVRV